MVRVRDGENHNRARSGFLDPWHCRHGRFFRTSSPPPAIKISLANQEERDDSRTLDDASVSLDARYSEKRVNYPRYPGLRWLNIPGRECLDLSSWLFHRAAIQSAYQKAKGWIVSANRERSFRHSGADTCWRLDSAARAMLV